MPVLPLICALLLGIGAGVVTGCGERSNLIPPQDASALKTDINAVQDAARARECGRSEKALRQARTTVTNLPPAVDDELRRRLLRGLDRLASTADSECAQPPITTTTTVPTTTTTEAEPPPTSTQPPTTTSTEETPTTPKKEPSEPGGGADPDPTPTGTAPVPDPGGAAPIDPGLPKDDG